MSSIPQQAVAKGIGQRLDLRDQLTIRRNWVVKMVSVVMAFSIPIELLQTHADVIMSTLSSVHTSVSNPTR